MFFESFGGNNDIVDIGSCEQKGVKESINLSLHIARTILESHDCYIKVLLASV